MLRIIHTADWHLGHSLHGLSRDYEHQAFLTWLLDRLQQEQVDGLVISGDIFDTANPPASALALFYRFLAEARRRMPQLDMVIIAGNHDSPARLEAPEPLLAAVGVKVVGVLPHQASGELDWDRLLVPLHDANGQVAAWCAAVPFLRPADLPVSPSEDDPLVNGVGQIYQEILTTALAQRGPGQALLALGHCYLVGTQLSELSERRILGGNQHALPISLFSPDWAYVALGHLHRPQALARGQIRYSGSPLPLSFGEIHYPHQVVRVDFNGEHCHDVEGLIIPRAVALLRLPKEGAQPLSAVLALLRHYPWDYSLLPAAYPFLEVAVSLEQPEPALRQQLEEVLAGKPVRLLKISAHSPGRGESLADIFPERQLDDLQPEEVFIRRYHLKYQAPPPTELMTAFRTLLEEIEHQELT